jgi:DNA polymerase III gamma/tau subunit
MTKPLTVTLKPVKWDDIIGQPLIVKILKGIVNEPTLAPKGLILQGPYGTGKSTIARVFASALNKLSSPEDLTHQHISILNPYDYNHKYKDFISVIENTFSGLGDKSVILFEEIHTMRESYQNELLRILDEEQEFKHLRFFLFNTTEIDKVIEPLRSRALELNFELASSEAIIQHLETIESKLALKKPIPENVKKYIAYSSRGHMRNVHMQLNRFLFLDENSYKEMQVSIEILCDYFLAVRNSDRDQVLAIYNRLSSLTLINLKYTFEEFILLCHQYSCGYEITYDKVGDVIKAYGDDIHKLYKLYFSDMFSTYFRSERDFKSGMLSFYQLLGNNQESR